jgi:hypothetical protein
MPAIGTLNQAVQGTVISPTEYNANMDAIKTAFNSSAVLTDTAKTVTAVHTFNPGSAGAAFVLGANAADQFIDGLNADQLDSQEGAFYRDADNLDAGTVPSARIAGSYTGITAVGTIATGTWEGTAVAAAFVGDLPASKLTSGTIASARISGAYTGITQVGTLTAGSIPATLLTGTIDTDRISGSYTGITAVGTLTSLNMSGDIDLNGNSIVAAANVPTAAFRNADFGTVGGGGHAEDTFTVSGAAVGDGVIVGPASVMDTADGSNFSLVGVVTSANTVTVGVSNHSGNSRDWSNVDLVILIYPA